MEIPQISLDTYVAIALVIATPWLYRVYRPFSSEPSTKTHTEQLISTAILAHTVYILYGLLVSHPQNIFRTLDLPLNASPDLLRQKLADSFGGEQNLPQYLEVLLKRLGLTDLRSFYIRFGHKVLTTCSYCQSFDDFALYAVPAPLLEYIREIALVGVLTLPKSSTAHLRPLGLGALLASLLTEAYWVLTVPVTIAPRGSDIPVTMWHDNFVQLRHILFLILPLLISVLPSLALHRIPILGAFVPAPESDSTTTENLGLPPARFHLHGQQSLIPANATLVTASNLTLKTLTHLMPTLHLLKYSHAAIMRSQHHSRPTSTLEEDDLHAKASEWWREEAREGDIVRADNNVRKALGTANLGVNEEKKDGDVVVQPEGQLLNSAKIAVNMLLEQGAPPSEHWLFAPVRQ